MYEYVRDAEVVFSLNERWVAINDYLGSNVAEVRLFRRTDGLKFRDETTAAVGDSCWRLLQRRHGIPFPWNRHHAYVADVRWAPDSRALVLVLWWQADEADFLRDWLCVYDLRSGQASRT